MNHPRGDDGRPAYDRYLSMADVRAPMADTLARQILDTSRPVLGGRASQELDVLDVGSGYGQTSLALGRVCRSVVGIEPSAALHARAVRAAGSSGAGNVTFRNESVDSLHDVQRYDLAVLDCVLEHLPHQAAALRNISGSLRVGGALFIIAPNKLWPIEQHYNLPFLSYLPLSAASAYLRWTGRGEDYTDASYATTYFGLRRLFAGRPELSWGLVLPANPSATTSGAPLHYRVGMAALRVFPALWVISKSFVVVAQKTRDT
jgi:2-polyprenyl-3-methyl-5-hydroxy-6-metoxy-1,4-benzoquinol methylase